MLLGRGIIDVGSLSQGFGIPKQQVMHTQPVQRSVANVGQFTGGPMIQPPMETTQPVQPTTPVVSDVMPKQQVMPVNDPVMTTMPVQQPQPQAFTQPVGKQLPMTQLQPLNASVSPEMGGGKGRGGMDFISPVKTLPVAQTY